MQMYRKIRGVREFCPHFPVGYSGSLSAINFSKKHFCELTSNSIRIRTITRNLEMKTNVVILYNGQLECWTSNLHLDGWALQLVLLIRGVSDFSS